MDSMAVTMAHELARFNIETSIVVPGAFTSGTDHFANAGKPADEATSAAYARYDGLMDQVGARLTELMPPEADPAAVAADIAASSACRTARGRSARSPILSTTAPRR